MKSQDSKEIHNLYSTGEDFESKNYDGIGAYPYAKYRMKMVLEILEKYPCDKILDLGCSTGRIIREWIMLGHSGEGIDFSEDLIAQGQKKMELADIDSSCLSVGDAKDLSIFASNQFDAVLALGLHPFMTKKEEIKNYKDILRILKPKGLIITSYINELVHFFTLNSYTVSLFSKIISEYDIKDDEKKLIIAEYSKLLTNPEFPPRTPTDSVRREHNPLTTPKVLENIGYKVIDIFFCKFFAFPTIFGLRSQSKIPYEEYCKKLEITHARKWYAYFNAHAFCIVGQK